MENTEWGDAGSRSSLRCGFAEILGSYQGIRLHEPMKGHPLFGLLRELREALRESAPVVANPYLTVHSSAGQGRWAETPVISVLDSRATDSAIRGVFVVYRFRPDGSAMYLILGQGVEDVEMTDRSTSAQLLRDRARVYRDRVRFLADAGIVLGEVRGLRTKPAEDVRYGQSVIAYRQYGRDDIPDDPSLLADLNAMLRGYAVAIRQGI